MKWLKCSVSLIALTLFSGNALSAETVRLSLFSWPGYGFWFVAQEKNLAPDLDLEITIIEDPYESFALMSAGVLDVTSSTAEYAPIAADKGVPVKMVTYTNPSYGTDKIVLAPGFESAEDLKGESVAVLEGGLTQIFMGIWLEENGVGIDEVEFTNLIMDDAVGALVGGDVSAAEFWEPFGSQALAALPGSTVVASSEEPGWIETALLGDAMYMSDSFLEEKPETATRVMQAYFDAVDYWKANPAEANEIIAKALRFPVSDVEKVIGSTGEIHKGGIWIFDKTQAAKYMGLVPGELPLGLPNGQVTNNWETVTDWWLKFGLIDERHPLEAGVDMTPLKAILESTQ
ncbi:ABC transporter [Marinobacter vulgaris]|uniref:ABC transporter n=1 Tax=Marinobacter vulgaris TaxID=1928331 RepID=A0A2V3ZHJ0_9GAMM|nr:ABC transporter substrate-binding protein [Marinobacter vulgaris]PXX89617.1 ABC transporter [Marinobacter vulgaris]TSJ68605.1 ABC transporter [Marinobacter vulgaris]